MSEVGNCRGCYQFNEKITEKGTKLKDKVKKFEVTLAFILSDCTGLYLEDESIESGFLCLACKQSLINFYKFRQKVFETDKKFKELKPDNVDHWEEAPSVQIKVEPLKLEEYESQDQNSIEEEVKPKKVRNLKRKLKDHKTDDIDSSLSHVTFTSFHKNYQRRIHRAERQENLKKYQRNDEGLYECPKDNCPGLFKNIGHLEMHLENKHPDTDQQSFPCETCGMDFAELLLYKRHFMKMHAPRPYMCDICGNSYPYLESLRVHIVTHIEGRKKDKVECACTVCGKFFSSEAYMLRHRKEVHFPKDLISKPYECNICNTRWASQSKLRCHMKNHNTSKDYKCEICGKAFNLKGSLTIHMQSVHNHDRPFFCDICGKTYKTKYNLRDHQITHDENRALKCSFCPATFKVPNSLHQHEKFVHSNEGPVSCDVCGKTCKNRSSLKSHLVLHRAQDIHCPHCDKVYKINDTLKRHIQRVHMGLKKRHECSICLKNLWSRKHIADHIEEAHKNELVSSGKTADELVTKYWTSDPSGANLGEVPPKGIVGRPPYVV
uniref:CSON004479 protein n=1 Tax=Culicoides sonorensis TaxID=179676 RepID=A0A336LX59_CULSO